MARGQSVVGFLLILAALSACAERSGETVRRSPDGSDRAGGVWAIRRSAMVRDQIEGRGVRDTTVLQAMLKVPRHLFVPEAQRAYAYEDYPLPIGYGQTISQPYIVALMTSLLNLRRDDRVLEVGTGSGYQAAILAEIADSVYTVEIVEPLADEARRTLASLGYDRVKVQVGDGYEGWSEAAPFDGIVVTCAPKSVPPPLMEQLEEGGRLVIPYGRPWFQRLVLIVKEDGQIREDSVIPVRFVPMTGPHGED